MQVVCPRCGRPVEGADIDLGSKLAVCRPCGEVVPVEVAAAVAPIVVRAPDGLFRPTDLSWKERELPEGTRRISISPPRGQAVILAFITALFDVCVLWLALGAGLAAALAFVFMALYFNYVVACALLNRTRVTIRPDATVIAAGPVPQTGGLREPTVNLVAFEAAEVSSTMRLHGGGGPYSTLRWGLHVLTRDGRAIPVRLGLPSRRHAEFAAARLNQVLEDAGRAGVPYRNLTPRSL